MKILDFYVKEGKKVQSFFLMGCLHWGCGQCNTRAIIKDLKVAQKRGDRILMVGDNLDLILWTDPRYQPHNLDSRFVKDDAVDRLVKDFADFLLPYADVIDVIGDGNHEYQLNKRYKTNIIARVIERINEKAGTQIRYGGYLYYAIYRFNNIKNFARDFIILGFHGKGMGAEVTKGMIDVNRLRDAGFIYDLMFFAHKHKDFATSNKWIIPHIRRMGDNFLEVRTTKETQVGTYKKNYFIRGDNSVGNNASWEEMKVFPFSVIGGKRATVKLLYKRKYTIDKNERGHYQTRNFEFETKVEV